MPSAGEAPVDYSFCNLAKLEDVLEEDPRGGICKRTVVSGGAEPDDEPIYAERPSGAITTLKLNNNELATLGEGEDFAGALDHILWAPEQLKILDLSFNHIEKGLKGIATSSCRDLGVLYLHSNAISSMRQVAALSGLRQLRSLTLHGNPIEKKAGYRLEVIAALPHLKKLDTSVISPRERKQAEFNQRCKPKRSASSD